MGDLWNTLLINPILNLLVAFYKLFSQIGLPGAFGWAIIALTCLIRLILAPLTHQQLKSAKQMADLKPRLDELNKKHKNDKTALQQAQLSLYKEAGINPAAGCLPLLVQMPVFIALYNVFIKVLNGGSQTQFIENINKTLYHSAIHLQSLDINFFGINLAVKPNEWQKYGIWLLLIPVVTAILQYLQTSMMTPKQPKKPETPEQEDTAVTMQKQMTVIMPAMIGFLALSFPVGLALYWNTFSLFGIIQQLKINRSHK